MKFCKDCRHFKHSVCMREQTFEPVNGDHIPTAWCEDERNWFFGLFGGCGPSGKHWEAKE